MSFSSSREVEVDCSCTYSSRMSFCMRGTAGRETPSQLMCALLFVDPETLVHDALFQN